MFHGDVADTVTGEEISSSDQFTENDLNTDWNTNSATHIKLNGSSGNVTGNGAYIYNGDVYIVYAGYYVISGNLTDGTVIIDADGDDDIFIMLDNVELYAEDTAAFYVEKADNVYVTLAEGSENYISSGSVYSEEAVEDGINGTIFSRDDLTINGEGSLTIESSYEHAIVAKDDFVVAGGALSITASEDGIHANDSVRIAEASIVIEAGDDGVTVSNDDASDYFYMESGSLTVNNCYEGVEAASIYVEGGEITLYPNDDGFNATSSQGDGIVVNDGTIKILNDSGNDADGFDSNGSITINGGFVFISLTSSGINCALDYGSENGGILMINGGAVIACGSSSMLEEVSEDSAQSFLVFTEGSGEAESMLIVMDEDENVLIEETIPNSFSAAILSTEEIVTGETYTVLINDVEYTATAGENSSGGFSMGGGSFGNFGGNMGLPGGGSFGGFGKSGMYGGHGHGSDTESTSEDVEAKSADESAEERSDHTEAADKKAAETDDIKDADSKATATENDTEAADDKAINTDTDNVEAVDSRDADTETEEEASNKAANTEITDSDNTSETMEGRQESVQMPEGMELPDGVEMPEGMELPDGVEMPDGAELPDGVELPEGEEMSQMMDKDSSEKTESTDSEQKSSQSGMRNPGNGKAGQMNPGQMSEHEDTEGERSVGTETFVLVGISFVALLFGVLFARRFKGKI